jgi:hypothetical protein
MVSKGFVVLAQNTDCIDYVRQAYALALSIKISQKNIKSISIITNDDVPSQYKSVFDNIIPIPWNDAAEASEWKVENRWKIFHVSPYDETIVLDTDMLLLEDINIWWDYCSNHDLKFCSKIKNYKQDYVIDTIHRKAFISNNLSNPYFALHYFKKSDIAYKFYKVLEFVSTNWEWCYTKFAPIAYQNWLSMDLATAIAIEIMGLQQTAIDNCLPFEFVHMKPPIQGWKPVPTSWQDTIPYVFNSNGDLIVGNIKQSKLFHYVEKNFITDNMILKLEAVYGQE